MWWKKAFLFLLIAFHTIIVFAQTTSTYTITGTCVNNKNIPIRNLLVFAEAGANNTSSLNKQTNTDLQGKFTITFSITTGIEEEQSLVQTAVSYPSPNPTGGNVSFGLRIQENKPVQWSIYNVNGEEVEKGSINNPYQRQQLILPFKNYANGIYFVRFIIDNKVVTHKINYIKGLSSITNTVNNFRSLSMKSTEFQDIVLSKLKITGTNYREKLLSPNQKLTTNSTFDIGNIVLDTLGYKVKGKVINVLKFDKPDSAYVPYAEIVFTHNSTNQRYVVRSDISGSYSLTLPEEPATYRISAFHDVFDKLSNTFKPIEFFSVHSDTSKNIPVIYAEPGPIGGISIPGVYNTTSIIILRNIMSSANKRWEKFPKIYINSAREIFINDIKKRIVDYHMPALKFYDKPEGHTFEIITGINPPVQGTSGYIIINETTIPAQPSVTTKVDYTTGIITSASISVWDWLVPNDPAVLSRFFNSCFFRAMTDANTFQNIFPSVINDFKFPSTSSGNYPLFDKMNLRVIYSAPPLFNFLNNWDTY